MLHGSICSITRTDLTTPTWLLQQQQHNQQQQQHRQQHKQQHKQWMKTVTRCHNAAAAATNKCRGGMTAHVWKEVGRRAQAVSNSNDAHLSHASFSARHKDKQAIWWHIIIPLPERSCAVLCHAMPCRAVPFMALTRFSSLRLKLQGNSLESAGWQM